MNFQGKTIIQSVEQYPLIIDNYGNSNNGVLLLDKGIPTMSVESNPCLHTSSVNAHGNNSLVLGTGCSERIRIPPYGITIDNTAPNVLSLSGTNLVYKNNLVEKTEKMYATLYSVADNQTIVVVDPNGFGVYFDIVVAVNTILDPNNGFSFGPDNITVKYTPSDGISRFFFVSYSLIFSVELVNSPADVGSKILLNNNDIVASLAYASIYANNKPFNYETLNGSFIVKLNTGDILKPQMTTSTQAVRPARYSISLFEVAF